MNYLTGKQCYSANKRLITQVKREYPNSIILKPSKKLYNKIKFAKSMDIYHYVLYAEIWDEQIFVDIAFSEYYKLGEVSNYNLLNFKTCLEDYNSLIGETVKDENGLDYTIQDHSYNGYILELI